MILTFQTAGVRNFKLRRQKIPRNLSLPGTNLLYSVFCVLYSVFFSFCLCGCNEPQEEAALWDQVKIDELAPQGGNNTPGTRIIKTINLDVHVFEVPAENVDKLDKIRKRFYIRPLRLVDYQAFNDNSFVVRFGKADMWNELRELLVAAEGQRAGKVSLLLADEQAQTIAVAPSYSSGTISFTGAGGSHQAANVGTGSLGLRVKAAKIPGSRGVCDVVAYPVFSPPAQSPIPELQTRVKQREFAFTAAAFALNMTPGDFVYLGPRQHVSDLTELGGLFFSNPQGSLFLNEASRRPPELKPSVRVFLLVCTRIDD